MKRIFYPSLFILISLPSFALNIRQIVVSRLTDSAINISLDTEGKELYYFSSWHYEVIENTIVLDAYFIEGFGSTIACLNNNFEIPLNTIQPQIFRLKVKVYYESLEDQDPQDFQDSFFTTPLVNPVELSSNLVDKIDKNEIVFVNPSDGILIANRVIQKASLYDQIGKNISVIKENSILIDMSNLSDGLYFISYIINNTYKIARIILIKK